MVSYLNELNNNLRELEDLIGKAQNRIKNYKNLESGRTIIAYSHGCPQYYFRKKNSREKKYIPSYEKDKIKLLVQRDYDEKILEELMVRQKSLQKFVENYDPEFVDKVFQNMCAGRRRVVEPIVATSEMQIKEWIDNNPGGQNKYEIQCGFLTKRGEVVRSKSEKILADCFESEGIPYSYEPALELKGGKVVYPDFALLNIKKNKTVYWEHLGLLSDEDYATKNFCKLVDYEENGIIVGDNLIISMETADRPLSIKSVLRKVELVFQ